MAGSVRISAPMLSELADGSDCGCSEELGRYLQIWYFWQVAPDSGSLELSSGVTGSLLQGQLTQMLVGLHYGLGEFLHAGIALGPWIHY